MAYPVIPESIAFGDSYPTTLYGTSTENVKYSTYGKPFISMEYPNAKWIPVLADGSDGYSKKITQGGGAYVLPPHVDVLSLSNTWHATLVSNSKGFLSSSRAVSIIRYTCKFYSDHQIISTPNIFGYDGRTNPPPGCWGGLVMIGDYPMKDHDIGVTSGPYYIAMSSRPGADGYVDTALVYPMNTANKNWSNEYPAVAGYSIFGRPSLQHDSVVNNPPQPYWLDINTVRYSGVGRARYANYTRDQSRDPDNPWPGDKSTKIIRPGGVGCGSSVNRYTYLSTPDGICLEYINVANGGCVEVEYAGATRFAQPTRKWELNSAIRNQNNRVVLSELTSNTAYIPNNNVLGSANQKTESESRVIFLIKANNSVIKINIRDCNFLSGVRARYQHIYLAKIIGSNNKIIFDCGLAGINFYGGEVATDEIYWYAGLCDNNTNEVIFTMDSEERDNIFRFEGGPPNRCRTMYPIAKAIGNGVGAQNLWISVHNTQLNEAKTNWYIQPNSFGVKPF